MFTLPTELCPVAQLPKPYTHAPSIPASAHGDAQGQPAHTGAAADLDISVPEKNGAELLATNSEKFSQAADVADVSDAADATPSVTKVDPSASKPTLERLEKQAHPRTKPTSKKPSICDEFEEKLISKKSGRAYVLDLTKGYPETLAVGSPELNGRIRAIARKKEIRLKQYQIDEINEELRSQAEESGLDAELYPRVKPLGHSGVEIDLCDGTGRTLQVTAAGVSMGSAESSARFIRTASAMSLPMPQLPGDFTRLFAYTNWEHVPGYLYLAWMTYTIAHPKTDRTKYVFVVIKGTQGSGKTFASKLAKRIIDPNAVTAQMLPHAPRELAIALQSCHLLVVDNVRELSPAMSDALCIAATGGSIGMRKLYSDDEQKPIHLHGAILFNGIHPFMGQSDFADRCLVLELPAMAAKIRKSEGAMLEGFEADLPLILGGVYELIAKTLKELPYVNALAPSRMVDFCRWLAAMELALGFDVGALQLPYADSLRDAQLESLLDNPLAVTIIEFADKLDKTEWMGTPTDFYDRLTSLAEFSLQRSRAWPTSAAVLSKRLHGLQAPLLSQGISIDWTRGKERQIIVRSIKKVAN